MTNKKINLITASAGSGKTYKLQETLAEYVDPSNSKRIRPEAVIATTFTIKAAQELKERSRKALIEKGYFAEAVRLEGALISTVHSVCTKLIEIFSYDSGLSPKLAVIPESDESIYFNTALSNVITSSDVELMEDLKSRLTVKAFGKSEYDWRNDVKKIIEAARSNGIGADGLKKSFEQSWKAIEPCFGTTIDAADFEKSVIENGEKVLDEFSREAKLSGKDEKFKENLEKFLRKLKNGYNITWDEWQSIAYSDFNKAGERIATSFTGLVANYIHHPKFCSDYQQFLKLQFEIAAKALEAYQTFKKERGVIDFADMECIVLDLLDRTEVQSRIKEEFDLLMVDEFQDTNPIQLAIFLKLSALIPNVVWVGDQKQSIYGFRGSDPSLMQGLMSKLKDQFSLSTLDTSYRSRPELVNYANDLFSAVFSNEMPKEQIVLKAHRPELSVFKNSLEIWRTNKTGKQEKGERSRRAIAKEVGELLKSGMQVGVKGKNTEARTVEPRDIAILCRTNPNCIEMAGLLKSYGLPVSLEQENLLFLPESKLLMAALRYYAFPRDSLAVIELKLLADGKDNIEELLEERINIIAEEKSEDYGKDHWLIKRIDEARLHELQLSPKEVVNFMIVSLELDRVVSSWGKDDERFENILQFKQLAAEYEDSCARLNMGATLGGFMLWLESKEEGKLLKHGGHNQKNSITIMTWHKSKGLEWPVVILNDCANEEKDRCFGINVISEGEFNPYQPLAGRYIRYWINPYQSSRSNNLHLIDQAKAIPTSQKIITETSREAARLLYVGFTRARDYLFIPLQSGKQAAIFQEVLGSTCDLPKNAGEQPLPWPSSKTVLVSHFNEIDQSPALIESNDDLLVTKAFKGPEVYPDYKINPSSFEQIENASASLLATYGNRLTIKGKVEDALLGDCLHDIAALDKVTIDSASRILKNYDLQSNLDASEIVHQLELFDAFITQNNFTHSRRELSITARIEGQLIEGIIDHLAESPEGFILIDHKTYQGTSLEAKALSYSGQLHIYKQALELTGKKVDKALIHFIAQGVVVEIRF